MKIHTPSSLFVACMLTTASCNPDYEVGTKSRVRLNLGLMVPPIQVKLPRLEFPQLIIGANIIKQPNAKPLTISMPPLPRVSFGSNYGENEGGYGGGGDGSGNVGGDVYEGGNVEMDQYSSGTQIQSKKVFVQDSKQVQPINVPDVSKILQNVPIDKSSNKKEVQSQHHQSEQRLPMQPVFNFQPISGHPQFLPLNFLPPPAFLHSLRQPGPFVFGQNNPGDYFAPPHSMTKSQNLPLQSIEPSSQSFFLPPPYGPEMIQSEHPPMMPMMRHPGLLPQLFYGPSQHEMVAPPDVPNSGYEVMPNFVPKQSQTVNRTPIKDTVMPPPSFAQSYERFKQSSPAV